MSMQTRRNWRETGNVRALDNLREKTSYAIQSQYTLTLPNGTVGEFVMEGEIIVRINNAVAPGYELQYATYSGILSAFPPGTPLGPGQAELPGAKITRVRQDDFGGGLAVIWIGNQTRGIPPTPPTP